MRKQSSRTDGVGLGDFLAAVRGASRVVTKTINRRGELVEMALTTIGADSPEFLYAMSAVLTLLQDEGGMDEQEFLLTCELAENVLGVPHVGLAVQLLTATKKLEYTRPVPGFVFPHELARRRVSISAAFQISLNDPRWTPKRFRTHKRRCRTRAP